MPSKLAAAVRAKYPGAYDNVDDATLEKAVVAKHPEYASYVEPEQKQPEGRSVSGFLSNAVTSGGRFLSDIAGAVPLLGKAVTQGARIMAGKPDYQALGQAGDAIVATPGALAKDYKEHYGSLDAAGKTLYEDPVRVLADLSTLAGGVGLGAKAGGAPRIARIATAASDATNPMRMVASPIAKATEYGTAAAVRPMLKPSKALKLQSDGPLAIERTALREGAVTEGLAKLQQTRAVDRATNAAASSNVAVPKGRIVSLPKSLRDVEQGLSHESDLNTLAQVEAEAADSLPDTIGASDLLSKRRHLDRELNNAFRAAERGGPPTGIRQVAQQEMLGNVRKELRTAAPDIREADSAARELGLVRHAISDAGLRAGDIPMGAALLGGGLFAGGIPGAGTAATLFGLGRTFPQAPLALGAVPVMGTAAIASPLSRKAALIAALIGRAEE